MAKTRQAALHYIQGEKPVLIARFRFPAQHGLARGADFVEAADARGMRRGLDDVGSGSGFLGNRAHGVHEVIALLPGFRFGGLNHHGAGDDEREGRGVGVEAVVDQALGDVHGAHAILFLPRVR